MYCPEGRTGFLYHAIYNENKKKRKAARELQDLNNDDERTLTEEEKEEAVKYFKRCVLPGDRKDVEKKMHETKSFRRDLILNDFEKYKECWKIFFVEPELVNFFFNKERYEVYKFRFIFDRYYLISSCSLKIPMILD